MRRLLTAATVTLLLTAVPAAAALAGERTGEPAEEPDHNDSGEETDQPDPVRDRQPADDDQIAGDDEATETDDSPDSGDAAAGPVECAEPVVSRSYTSGAMVLSLELTMVGCDWWNGEALELVGVIGRDDGSDEEGSYAFALNACEAVENEDWRERNIPRFDKKGCAIEVALPHPAAEVAHYYGGISYQWEGEPRRVELETTCVSTPWTADCRDAYGPAVRGPGIRT